MGARAGGGLNEPKDSPWQRLTELFDARVRIELQVRSQPSYCFGRQQFRTEYLERTDNVDLAMMQEFEVTVFRRLNDLVKCNVLELEED